MKKLIKYFIKKNIILVLAIFGLGTIASVISLIIPLSYQYLIDSIIVTGIYERLMTYSVLILLIFCLYTTLDILTGYFIVKATIRLNAFLSKNIFEKVMLVEGEQPYSKGEIITRMINDVNTIVTIISEYLLTSFLSLLTYIVALIFILSISRLLGIICVISSPIFFILSRYFGKKIGKDAQEVQEKSERYLDILNESIDARDTVKLYDCYDYQNSRYQGRLNSFLNSNKRLMNISLISKKTFQAISIVFPIIILVTGAYLIQLGNITIGKLISVLSFLNYIMSPSAVLSNILIAVRRFKVAVNRINMIYQILDIKELEIQEKTQVNLSNKAVAIEFENINVTYGDKAIFRNLNLNIHHNEFIAIVGLNGTGKTTLIKMLVGLITPKKGSIYIYGTKISKKNQKQIRGLISIAPQKDFLFSDKVSNNILLQEKETVRPESIEYLISHNLWQKEINKNASNLSGGEIQKICLARALLRGNPILIIDEGTSQMDRLTNEQIYREISLKKGKQTILIVDHQLRYVSLSDRVLYIKDDSNIYLNTHKQLLACSNDYRQIFSSKEGN